MHRTGHFITDKQIITIFFTKLLLTFLFHDSPNLLWRQGLSDDSCFDDDFLTMTFLTINNGASYSLVPSVLVHYNHRDRVHNGTSGSKMELVDPKLS